MQDNVISIKWRVFENWKMLVFSKSRHSEGIYIIDLYLLYRKKALLFVVSKSDYPF